jgi:hypothetical protein
MVQTVPPERIDLVVTDQGTDASQIAQMRTTGIEVLVAPASGTPRRAPA